MKSVLNLRNGTVDFRFLFESDGKNWKLYIPDKNPIAYDLYPILRLEVSKKDRSEISEYYLSFMDAEACVPFKHEQDFYKCYWHNDDAEDPTIDDSFYLSLEAVFVDDFGNFIHDPDYISCQSAYILSDYYTELPSAYVIGKSGEDYLVGIDIKIQDLTNNIKETYRKDDELNVTPYIVGVISGDEDVYFKLVGYSFESDKLVLKIQDYTDGLTNLDYKEDMRLAYQLYFILDYDNFPELSDEELEAQERRRNDVLLLQSTPSVVTQEDWAKLISDQTLVETIFKNMEINEFRIINKNVQNVINMTAETDSKSNIVQPIFYRTRELASVIIHPAVTENICINLDAYKGACAMFTIQIEGMVFPEIGRTDAGSIFKITGTTLPGRVRAGVYYVLNQDGDLVTTGKYTYEG